MIYRMDSHAFQSPAGGGASGATSPTAAPVPAASSPVALASAGPRRRVTKGTSKPS